MLNKTYIVILLDRSGSMHKRRDDHEGGLRSFVHDQKQLAGDVRLTFVRFDDVEPFELVLDRVPMANVREEALTLIPRGDTPLLDAVGRTLAHVRLQLAEATEKPDQVVILVITDGQENASRQYTKDQVKAAVSEREAAGWKVLYLGANVDEFAEAGAIGIGARHSLGYAASREGISSAYASLSNNVTQMRCAAMAGENSVEAYKFLDWTEEQRRTSKGKSTTGATSGGAGSATGGDADNVA